MLKTKKRSVVVVLAVVGLLGLGYWSYGMFRAPGGSAPAAAGAKGAGGKPGGFALPVETARVVVADLPFDATAVGSLRSNESVVLRPETAGRIASINFKEGTAVTRGSLLIGLDAAMQAAEYDQARANLALSAASVKRSRELFEKKFVSQQSLDNAEAALKVQEAALALAQAKLDKTRLKAPFTGIVGIRNVSVGDYVKEGQDLINLEDISTLKIDFRLPEAYLSQLHPGQVIEVTPDAFPGQRFEAVLDAINPLIETGGRAIACRARLANPEAKLRPGMFARVRLIFEQRSNVLLVPEQAIVPDMKAPYVFRVVDGKAEPAPVKTGLRRAGMVEVSSGLSAGDEVVTAGQMKLRPGAPVMATRQREAGAQEKVVPADEANAGKPAAAGDKSMPEGASRKVGAGQ